MSGGSSITVWIAADRTHFRPLEHHSSAIEQQGLDAVKSSSGATGSRAKLTSTPSAPSRPFPSIRPQAITPPATTRSSSTAMRVCAPPSAARARHGGRRREQESRRSAAARGGADGASDHPTIPPALDVARDVTASSRSGSRCSWSWRRSAAAGVRSPRVSTVGVSRDPPVGWPPRPRDRCSRVISRGP